MTKSSKISTKTHKKAVLLALSAGSPPPEGERPSLLEIELWRQKKLPKKRSAEVKSYVARDADCYQLWQDLLMSEQLLNNETQAQRVSLWQRCQNWLIGEQKIWQGGGLAVAVMAVFVGVIGLKSFLHPDMMQGIDQDYEKFSSQRTLSGWSYKSYEKTLSFVQPTPYDKAKKAVSVGIRSGLIVLQKAGKLTENEWQAIIQQYPAEFPDCPESMTADQCQKQNDTLQVMGRWLALMQLQCAQEEPVIDTEYYRLQQQRIDYFSEELVAFPVIEPLIDHLHSVGQAIEKKMFCHKIVMLLNHIDN